ncbi:hypothetical protein [Elizabethkingia anophelis]|nr:hypothetical protein [Elizabethkingia anophelis]MCL1689394.1 hypothetical protein [Elizabethkingia anophelis]
MLKIKIRKKDYVTPVLEVAIIELENSIGGNPNLDVTEGLPENLNYV